MADQVHKRPDTRSGFLTPKQWIIGLVVVAAVAVVAGALSGGDGSSDGHGPFVVGEGLQGSSGVDWNNYAPAVRTRIDDMAVEGDCAGLQAEFDTAEANDDAQRDRVGDGNADLMDYIDGKGKMESAGCYG